jgi:fucose 4-O-acetylase-like acetyltransferase
MANQRLQFLDVGKGLLILLVVLGHSSFPFNQFIYWFHMPAFFLIGGIVHKQPEGEIKWSFIRRKFDSLIIPYLSFGLSISIIIACYSLPIYGFGAVKSWVLQFGRLLYSGGGVFGAFGAFWFIPCLFLTILVFGFVRSLTKNNTALSLVLLLFYLAGFVLGKFPAFVYPWSINVVPMAVFFYGLGYQVKSLIFKLPTMPSKKKFFFLPLLLICIVLIICSYGGYIEYNVDVKNAVYGNIVLAMIIPLIFTTALIFLSMIVEKTLVGNILKFIGLNSMVIMYLHLPINAAFVALTNTTPHYVVFVALGTLISMVIGYAFAKNQFTQRFFLGKPNKTVQSAIPLENISRTGL